MSQKLALATARMETALTCALLAALLGIGCFVAASTLHYGLTGFLASFGLVLIVCAVIGIAILTN